MPKIHVDQQVLSELARRGAGRPPNDVIRELLGFSYEEPEPVERGAFLIPHGEYNSPEDLADSLSEFLAEGGEYLVASTHYWRNVPIGSICLFHKKKVIVGEAKTSSGLLKYTGDEISPRTGRKYAGQVQFGPVKIYEYPVRFEELEPLIGKKLTYRGIQHLTNEDLETARKIAKVE